ncbi:YtxH domain-containing protein [Flavihumibacter fluvii]|uniref:YtxH domain-containing protein n=1 Tax=Flavihumibacter fluvii TaxID=2838157 RepID=UPI001BDEE0F6|nr:YtxH domain-containing protein [Flavihumibacter fluvii]ULQ52615.1 YtxH domain-containing protein [Flavihumibacter fluvii]
MSDNSKFLAGVLLGAAAGAAIGYLLTTEKGREIINDLKTAATNAAGEVKDTVNKWASEAEEEVNSANT